MDVYRAFRSDDVFAVPRVRLAVKGGLAVHTLTVEHPTVVSLACRITAALGVRGPANLQFIEDARGELWFLECNPRFGGATIASITAGLDGPGYLLREHFRQPLAFGGYRANLRMLRYWNEVYES